MYYDKQIRYIDYLENGEKKRNCGYVKVTVTGGRLFMDMRIRDLYETDDVVSDVVLEGDGRESRIGTVRIRQGCGSFRWECADLEQEGDGLALGEGIRYGQLERIHVQLSPRRSMRCIWKASDITRLSGFPDQRANAAEQADIEVQSESQPESITGEVSLSEPQTQLNGQLEKRAEETSLSEPQTQPNGQSESRVEEASLSELQTQLNGQSEKRAEEVSLSEPQTWSIGQPESVEGDVISSELQLQPTCQPERAVEDTELPVRQQEDESEEAMHSEREERPVRQPDGGDTAGDREKPKPPRTQRTVQAPHMASMSEDKWQQLQKIYPHIRPFQDEREYLSLRPEDFVILPSDAYRLVQNSFLLHGYFNYEHLILTCVPQKGGDQYYIGVPGNFFEKEKQVAVMYGFESFECRREPAGEGEFGYYMIRVRL